MFKAECTWGDGPDVLLVIEDRGNEWPLQLLEGPTELERFSHGICEHASVGMTAKQARELAEQLLLASSKAEFLEEGRQDAATR
jgi:hypothetical protein